MMGRGPQAVEAERTDNPVLSVENLRVQGPGGVIVANLSLTVASGETVAIVGESGSGKSITARAMTGLLPRGLSATGEVRYRGSNLLAGTEQQWRSIRGHQIGFVLQDPFTMLNPVAKCGRIITESLPAGQHRSRRERREEAVHRLREVGIHDPSTIDRYPFQISGGMRQRVAIAAALARDPQVLIADEPTTALDVTTQRDLLALIKHIQADRGMALVLITHDLRVAFSICDRVSVMYAGSMVEVAPPDALAATPMHPYSQGLLLSEPPVGHKVRELVVIPGSVPTASETTGCPFAPRCRWVAPECTTSAPTLAPVGSGRWSACVRLPDIEPQMRTEQSTSTQALAENIPHVTPRALVSVVGLSKTFGTRRAAVPVLKDVSIEIGENESVGLVGESGSGKTTLARSLVGLEQPTDGRMNICGVGEGLRRPRVGPADVSRPAT